LDGNCNQVDDYVWAMTAGIFNIVSDIAILLIPQRAIWKLNMPLNRKIGISFLFALGLLAVAITIIRSILALHYGESTDFTYHLTEILLCASWELTIGILVGCVPSLPRVLAPETIRALKKKITRSRLWTSSKDSLTRPWRRERPSTPQSTELVPSDNAQLFTKLHYHATGSGPQPDRNNAITDGQIYRNTEFHRTNSSVFDSSYP
jgi:hypothetical protein